MDKYWLVFKNAWQEELEFRFNTFLKLVIAFVSLIGIFFLWTEVYKSTTIELYSKNELVTYYIIIGYLFASIFPSIPIAHEIETGKLSNYLIKPVNYLFFHYVHSLSRRLFRLVAGFPVVFGIFFIFREHLYFVTNWESYLLLFFLIFSAINILYLFDVILSFVEFWVYGSSAINFVIYVVVGFFSGATIPLSLLPETFIKISNFLPFKYTGYFIIQSFMGKNNFREVIFGVGIEVLWFIGLFLLAKFIWKKGLIRYEAFGG